ncbi:ImmA/IrrE family metallo-endopeptidase [Achromobacter xylosoxidans]
MSEPKQRYEFKGSRVSRLSATTIQQRAKRFGQIMKIGRRTRYQMAQFIESLSDYKICIDPVADEEWLFVTDGICTPENLTIRVPESAYRRMCAGDQDAIGLLFHELGHLMLAHKIVLHNERSAPPSPEEDSEWQADAFATFLLARMKLPEIGQLSLNFDYS